MTKIIYEQVKKAFQDRSYVLLEKEYVNSRSKMRYVCKCGKESQITWNNFKKIKEGRNCCGRKKRMKGCIRKRIITIEYLKNYFSTNGCKLLEDEYKGYHVSMKYICVCSRESKIYWANFRRGGRCKHCGAERLKGNKHYRWNTDRDKVILNERLRGRYYSILKKILICTGKNKERKSSKLLGYTSSQLKFHLENHSNWNEIKDSNWTIDHIFPIKAFIEYEIYDSSIINCLDNLQPMEASFNFRKGAKYNKQDFELWLQNKGFWKPNLEP